MTTPVQPVLVLPVYRGGAKFARALASIRPCEHLFRRIVVSLNSSEGSEDRATVAEFLAQGPSRIEVIQTGAELPWMQHQYFWLTHLEQSGETGDDWVMWFAHDDQLRPRGIANLVDSDGNWPIEPHVTYLGPWGMRYDPLGGMYDGPIDALLESWTSFPLEGPLRLPVAEWIAQQLELPTYINMSGCVTQLASFQALRKFPYAKPGGMRIEMATAAAPNNRFVQEMKEPIVITYTSKGSDRTTYAKVARKDDLHMAAWFANYLIHHPGGIRSAGRAAYSLSNQRIQQAFGKASPVKEDWRYRATTQP